MKKQLCVLCSALFLAAIAAEKDYSGFQKVATDQGKGPMTWEMCSGDYNPIHKKLVLEVPPADIKEAAIEYEIRVNPYDPKVKDHITKADYPWEQIQVKVNGVVAGKYPAWPLIKAGTHRIDIPVKLLKEGENEIVIGWAVRTAGKKHGYIYFGIDNTPRDKERRKNKKQTPAYNDDIRIRLLIKL